MADAPLTAERIIEAAEDSIRRFGPDKANVVDVARALGVSHGSVYRHFPSKAALRDAVAERWLKRVSAPLEKIAAAKGTAPARLKKWLEALIAVKRGKVLDEPELLATYHQIAGEARSVVDAHVAALAAQLERIVADGIAEGSFAKQNAKDAANAVLTATARFHHPAHASEWTDPNIGKSFDAVWRLVLGGLKAG